LDKMIFSQTGVYRLQQLAKQVHSITGIRHKLSDPEEVITLLKESSRSNHQVIQAFYMAFTSELDQHQIISLTNQGIPLKTH
jgi:DNA gyrase/topoisomerase IV subunit A